MKIIVSLLSAMVLTTGLFAQPVVREAKVFEEKAVKAAENSTSHGSGNLEAISRQDFTGQGSYHRIGMLRQQETAIRLADKQKEAIVKPRRKCKWFCAGRKSTGNPRHSLNLR